MGYLKYLKKSCDSEEGRLVRRERLIAMRKENATMRLERPTRLDRARALGYKPKQGVVIVRQRVLRGGHTRPDIKGGRRPKHSHQRKNLSKNYQQIAEERVARAYTNCEIVGSYLLDKDGKHYWYEVIIVDRESPQVLADKNLAGIATKTGRSFRGVTSAGRKGRGLLHKGLGAEKLRPSKRSHSRKG